MFKFLGKLLLSFISNGIALFVAYKLVPGFSIAINLSDFLYVTAVFTLINLVMRPILKLLLGPIIILTLGLGLILINMLTLYALGFLTAKVAIAGLLPLLYASLIIGVVNFTFHFLTKGTHKD